jgi:hypothetical protein
MPHTVTAERDYWCTCQRLCDGGSALTKAQYYSEAHTDARKELLKPAFIVPAPSCLPSASSASVLRRSTSRPRRANSRKRPATERSPSDLALSGSLEATKRVRSANENSLDGPQTSESEMSQQTPIGPDEESETGIDTHAADTWCTMVCLIQIICFHN